MFYCNVAQTTVYALCVWVHVLELSVTNDHFATHKNPIQDKYMVFSITPALSHSLTHCLAPHESVNYLPRPDQ